MEIGENVRRKLFQGASPFFNTPFFSLLMRIYVACQSGVFIAGRQLPQVTGHSVGRGEDLKGACLTPRARCLQNLQNDLNDLDSPNF